MALCIVPNDLSDAIYKKIDEQLVDHPALVKHREEIYKDLLSYFDEYGKIPNFSLQEKGPRDE